MLEIAIAALGPVALLSATLWSINRHFRTFDGFRDPALLGLVTDSTEFDVSGPLIGRWGKYALYQFVVASDRRFEYDRLVNPDYRYKVAANELFIAPGMVYIMR
jgi:hypothetical protein